MKTLYQSPTQDSFVQNPYQVYAEVLAGDTVRYWNEYEMAAVFDAAVFLTAVFLADAVFFTAVFLAAVFFTADFLTAVFFAAAGVAVFFASFLGAMVS